MGEDKLTLTAEMMKGMTKSLEEAMYGTAIGSFKPPKPPTKTPPLNTSLMNGTQVKATYNGVGSNKKSRIKNLTVGKTYEAFRSNHHLEIINDKGLRNYYKAKNFTLEQSEQEKAKIDFMRELESL